MDTDCLLAMTDGVVAIGTLDQPQWVFGKVDLDRIAAVRADGRVLNLWDWKKQQESLGYSP